MSITLNSGTPVSGEASSGTATSLTLPAFTPGLDLSDGWIIAVCAQQRTIATATAAMTAECNGNPMIELAQLEKPLDPYGRLGIFAYDIGNLLTNQVVEFLTATGRLNGHAFCLNDVPDQAAVHAEAEDIGTLGIVMTGSGILIDLASVWAQSTAVSPNPITINGAQTAILNTVRSSGASTEGRLSSSYKFVTAGSVSGANSSPFADGRLHAVIGLLDSVGGAPAFLPRVLQY